MKNDKLVVRFKSLNEMISKLEECWDFENKKRKTGVQIGRVVSGNHACMAMEEWFKNQLSPSWAGVSGRDEYMELMKKEPALNKKTAVETNPVLHEGTAMDLQPSVAGEFIDPVAHNCGLPFSMGDFVDTETNNYATIVVNPAVSGNTELSAMQKKVKALAEGVLELEAKKVRTRIEYIFPNPANDNQSYSVILKNYDENYVNQIHGNILGSYATVRGLGYAMWSLFNTDYGLGKAQEPVESHFESGRVSTHISFPKDTVETITSKLKLAANGR